MTIAQAERFYNEDEKKYELNNNNDFINWLKDKKNNGYENIYSLELLQHVINTIFNWYEIKYSDRDFDEYDAEFEDMISISKYLDFNQLLYRLKRKEMHLINCEYMSKGGISRPIYDKHGQIVKYEPEIVLKITKKGEIDSDFANYYKAENQPEFFIYANSKTGKVNLDFYLEPYIFTSSNSLTLEGLLKIFEETQKDNLDYTELKNCINNYNTDLELRKIILQLTALKILYSPNTIPEYGYERAKKFIIEFNENINDLNLSIEEIDSIINKDYDNKDAVEETKEKTKIKRKVFLKKKKI